jgi:transposase
MGRTITAIDAEGVARAESALKDLGKSWVIARRLQAIISAYKHGIKKASEVLEISRATIHRWMSDFGKEGVNGLLNDRKPSRSKLNEEQKLMLKSWVESNPACTLKELVLRCINEMGITIGKSSIHRTLEELGFSYITGRKKHYKSNPELQDSFKKN